MNIIYILFVTLSDGSTDSIEYFDKEPTETKIEKSLRTHQERGNEVEYAEIKIRYYLDEEEPTNRRVKFINKSVFGL